MAKEKIITENQKLEIAFLSSKWKLSISEIRKIMGVEIPSTSFYRCVKQREKYLTEEKVNELSEKFKEYQPQSAIEMKVGKIPDQVEFKIENTPKQYEDIIEKIWEGSQDINEDKICSDIKKYFGLNLKSFINEYKDIIPIQNLNVEEMAELSAIYNKYYESFGFKVTDNVISSIREKYVALKSRNLDAVTTIFNAIDYTKRRMGNTTHKWRFMGDEWKTAEEKILANIITLCKNMLDGKVYRSLSETQDKIVSIMKKLLNRDVLPFEAERKILEMIGKYDILDIVNNSLQLSKNKTPELMFLEAVEGMVNQKSGLK